jgi:hypothetical protein
MLLARLEWARDNGHPEYLQANADQLHRLINCLQARINELSRIQYRALNLLHDDCD